jgi:peptidoglycan/LPS O-acetylase OafA/YrhL
MIKAHPWTQYLSDTITALAFANLILTINLAKSLDWRFLHWHGHKTLADFSFTLYAIHNPTLMLLRAITTAVLGPGWSVGFASYEQWVALALAMSMTIALAYMISRFTEGKVGAVRRYVKSSILRLWPDPASVAPIAQR